ncbi:MAG: DUF1631 family protein [Rhodoferax sp.]
MKKFLRRHASMVHDQSSNRPTLQDCLEAVLMQADNLMDDVLEGLVKAAAPAQAKRSFGGAFPVSEIVANLLLMQAASVKATFTAQLRLGLYNMGAAHLADQPSLRFDDLQQLNARQIDASIEFAMAHQEVLRCVDDLLPALDALVSSLLGWITVQPQLNPLKPEVFVRALQVSLGEHAPDEKARVALITPAAGLLGAGLRRLYREVCNWLRSQGIEPASAVGALPGAAVTAGKGADNAVSRALVTLDKLRKLLSGELNSGSGNPVGQDFLHTMPACYDALEDMKLIEPMMKRLAQRASLPVAPGAPLEAAAQTVSREPTQGKQLGKQLGAEVVRLMLDNLMQDERLLRPVRALIKTLEPVLLALSDADPRFFSERQHPARQFLDRVTHRSLGFTSENDEGFSRFLGSISEAVKALGGGDGDAAAFAQGLRQLDAGWAQEEAAQRQQQEEAARALLHVEQRNLLAQRLADDFVQQQKDKQIPEMVSAFLRGPWAQVVAEAQLGCADGSADPGAYLALVDDLLWSVQPQLTRRNRVRLVELVPNLLVKLRHGLQLIGYPEERIPVLFDALITLHEKAFEGRRMAPNAITQEPTAQAAGEPLAHGNLELLDEEGFWIADDEAQESGYGATGDPDRAEADVQRPWSAVELNPGAWVELIVDDVWLRAQLTWASPHRTLFMFISRGGVAHSMSRRTMERLRMSGRVRLISDGHVLDNALDAVAQTALQNELDQAEKQP